LIVAQWQFQEANARLSELVRAAQIDGPQTVTVRGQPSVVVLSQRQYRNLRTQAARPSFTALMRASPLIGVELDVPRDRSSTRNTAL
jgi:antitoxin Phd